MINNTQKSFLELVKAGLWGNGNPIIRIDETTDWQEVYRLASEQSVLGLVLDGLEHSEMKPPKVVLLQWIGEVQMIEQRNKAMNAFVAEAIGALREQDIYALLVKGQGIAQCYEKPLWRSSGDIDLLLSDSNYDKAKEYYEKSLVHLKDHFWRGNANYRLGKYAEAASEYGKLGNNAEAKYNIGNCFVNMYDPEVPSSSLDDAILAYDQALELDPNHADASMNKTVIIEFLRKKREAERAEQEARAKENNLTGPTSGSSGYLGLQNSLSGTTLLQRRMILQQSKKNYKTTEQKW